MGFDKSWKIYNPTGIKRILVTRNLPGQEWLNILSDAGYRVEVWMSEGSLTSEEIIESIGNNCTAVIGQLTEKWDAGMFGILNGAGGIAYCNYAVGYDNVDVEAATLKNIAVGNTPGVLTETTAEMAVALTMAMCKTYYGGRCFYEKRQIQRLASGSVFRQKTMEKHLRNYRNRANRHILCEDDDQGISDEPGIFR